jgi:uncharacterized protein YyaL (SSP411 family)
LCTGDVASLVVAQRLVELAASLLAQHPGAVPDLVEAAGFALSGVEVVIPGDANDLSAYMDAHYAPRAVLVAGSGSSDLLVERESGVAYVCQAGVCQLPVTSVADLATQLRNVGT